METTRFEETTIDGALGGALKVCQPAKGFRFSVDALLLARFASRRKVSRAADLGCGCGVVGLSLLTLGVTEELVGIDIQAAFVELACKGAALNSLESRARFETLDVKDAPDRLGESTFDLVAANPPYRSPASSRVSPDPSLAAARFEILGALPDFVDAGAKLLKSGGEMVVVYPANRFRNLLDTFRQSGLTPSRLRPIHPRIGEPASLALAAAIKGEASLTEEEPLYLHGEAGSGRKYSTEASILLGCGS